MSLRLGTNCHQQFAQFPLCHPLHGRWLSIFFSNVYKPKEQIKRWLVIVLKRNPKSDSYKHFNIAHVKWNIELFRISITPWMLPDYIFDLGWCLQVQDRMLLVSAKASIQIEPIDPLLWHHNVHLLLFSDLKQLTSRCAPLNPKKCSWKY